MKKKISKKAKIAIVGHFGENLKFYDGQTVSTRLLKNVLSKSGQFEQIVTVDTYNYRKNFIKILFSWIASMFRCKYIIFMLSKNGLKVFPAMFYYANKIFKRKYYHRVIGGEIDNFLANNPKAIKYMNSFEVNWVQSKTLVKKLSDLGLNNAEYLENFREITPISLPETPTKYEKPFKFCTFCRVTEPKGIGIAIDSIAKVNEIMGECVATLDIYGPIDDAYNDTFQSMLDNHKDYVKYMGSVPSEQAVDTLKNYYMHLFPTTWSGEGFPGTLIDCYNAALPTIASSWAYNPELITEGQTGYLYDWKEPEQLTEKIIESIQKNDNVWYMKKMCLEETEKYKSEVVTAKIISRILDN